jgi:hypothetical protein
MIVARYIQAHILKRSKRVKGIWNSKQEALKPLSTEELKIEESLFY